jgi:uncharacterized protein HemX
MCKYANLGYHLGPVVLIAATSLVSIVTTWFIAKHTDRNEKRELQKKAKGNRTLIHLCNDYRKTIEQLQNVVKKKQSEIDRRNRLISSLTITVNALRNRGLIVNTVRRNDLDHLGTLGHADCGQDDEWNGPPLATVKQSFYEV